MSPNRTRTRQITLLLAGPAALVLTAVLAAMRGDVLVASSIAILAPAWALLALRHRSTDALLDECMVALSHATATAMSASKSAVAATEHARSCYASMLALRRLAEDRREVDVAGVVNKANEILECSGARVRMHVEFPAREVN